MHSRATVPQEILLPVKPAFIVATLIAALLANLLPWSGWWLWLRPDFVALIVLYWCIEEPRTLGFTAAWLLGLLMDVADGSLFGQHALAYSILAYAGIVLHRRVQRFSVTPQMLHVIPLLLLNDIIVLLIRMLTGSDFPGYQYFIGSFIGGALWPVISILLKLPQRPTPDPDHA
ncbi:MAG: rod shape-determining protein MreD [Betaproteobacteria bacterium]|nr:rod shape-determining protein MreD [Betaproteobacteria bacterium]